MSREILKYFELNENKIHQNLSGRAKTVLRGHFIVLNVYILKKRKILNPSSEMPS
jgi:hypothetical protein